MEQITVGFARVAESIVRIEEQPRRAHPLAIIVRRVDLEVCDIEFEEHVSARAGVLIRPKHAAGILFLSDAGNRSVEFHVVGHFERVGCLGVDSRRLFCRVIRVRQRIQRIEDTDGEIEARNVRRGVVDLGQRIDVDVSEADGAQGRIRRG